MLESQVIFVKPKQGVFIAKARGLRCACDQGAEMAARKLAMKMEGSFGRVPCLGYWEMAKIKLEQLGPLAFRAEWQGNEEDEGNEERV